MNKQKICIIGGGLTGLVTAISLSKLDCKIDLITGNVRKNLKSNRTIAISQNNFNFLKKLNIFKSMKQIFWPCSKMKLYTKNKNNNFSEIFEINNINKLKKILYMVEISKLKKYLIKKTKQTKSISVKTGENISKIFTSGLLQSVKYKNHVSKYNLVIICVGNNSDLIKKLFHDQSITNSYEEISITTILNHSPFNNCTVRQIFFDNEILALLPISKSRTSIVWSLKKNIYRKNDLLLKNKIKYYAKNYLKEIKFEDKIEYVNLNFFVRSKYYQDRALLFGDALHKVHPLAGQGFNMTLRDLASLQKILSNKMSLGLDIGSSDILSEFSEEIKPRNFAYSMGIDILKNYFSFKNPTIKSFRNNILKILNKNSLAKDVLFSIADKGFKF